MRASNWSKVTAQSEQPSRTAQQLPPRRYLSSAVSPVAHMPNLSALSPLYPLPMSPNSATSSTTLDDVIGDLFTRYLPPFFDLLENFQYQKALEILEHKEDMKWKSWEAFQVMVKLGASCESTYHLMKYLETELVQTDTIEKMYGKLVVLMHHLADELKPIAARQSRRFSIHSSAPSSNAGDRNDRNDRQETGEDIQDDHGYTMDQRFMMDIAMCGDMRYYIELLEQGAEFFSLRGPMIRIYRDLALSTVPRDYHDMLKQIESLLLCYDTFNHPLLETMKQSSSEELSTVHAALQCEIRVSEYDFTRSIVALHRLKVQLRSWSDHIDAVSDYPLFESNSVNVGANVDGEGLLLDEPDGNYGITSDLVFSSLSYQSCASHGRGHVRNLSLSSDPYNAISDIPGGASPSFAESCASYNSGRLANIGLTSCDVADELGMLEKHQSGVSINSSSSPAVSEAHSTFRRLLSHSSLLRRSTGLTSALPIRCGLVQKPGNPYIGSSGTNSSMPNNALEQAILGGGGNSTSAGGVGTSLGASQGASNGEGIVLGGSTNAVAAEMMASSMKNQERDDGFALPVFQWSKRFYRSLVAKFTLYFHRWLEPFEKKTDYLALELSRFIKTPLGISYLQLMDVLLSRISHQDESQLRVMLILETQALENRGAHYYEKGYRCPSSRDALYTSKDQEKQDEQVEQAKHRTTITSQGHTENFGISSTLSATSRGGGASPANGRRRSVDHHVNHALFMRVDREENEEQNDFSELWGLRSWPAVFCYPEGSEPPLAHWPNIVSLIMDNRSSLDSVRPVFVHSERRQKTTYHISRVDDAMYLVLLAEGVKKCSRKVAQDFMQAVTENLQHSGAFAPRILVSTTPISA